jgi:hypothetical protein
MARHRIGRRFGARTAATAALALVAVLVLGAGPAQAALNDLGPADPATGLPTYYQDDTGLRLEPCLTDTASCVPGTTVPDPTSPPSVWTGNLAPEEFYYAADSTITMPTGGQALLVVGLQNGWTSTTQCGKSPCPAPGKQAIFGRVRFRIDDLTPGVQYTVRYPWGTQVVTPASTGKRSVNLTIDTGCAATAGALPCDPTLALQALVGPFLGWDPAVAPAAPAGFLGSYAVPHRITGSRVLDSSGQPQNYFSIEGPDIPTMRTDLFQVAGQVARPSVPDTQAPTAPTGLTATPHADGTVALSWAAATDDRGVAGYEIHRDGATSPTLTASGTSVTDTGLAPNSTHTYTVNAFDAAHNVSTPSAQVSVLLPPPPPVPPSAPGAVSAQLPATSLGTGSVPVQLAWGAATSGTGIAGYAVEVTNADDGTTSSSSAPGTSATISLAPGHHYRAWVHALAGDGTAGPATSTTFSVALPQENDTAMTYGKGWGRKKLAAASGGFTESTSTAGATATFRFSGTAFAWVATPGPAGGQVVVKVDGVALPGTVDLHASTATPRRLVLARSGLAAGPHVVTVTLPTAAGRGKAATSIDVDAFATLAP